MNSDCIFLIFEKVKFDDLLNVAQIDKQFSTLAADVFRCKYSHLKIVYKRHVNDPPTEEWPDYIKILNHDTLLNTFKYFGHFIKKFNAGVFEYHVSVDWESIGQMISNYSSESLVEIEIEKNVDTFLPHITKPLTNVQSVSFFLSDGQLGVQTNRPDKLFPALRRITMHFMNDVYLEYFGCHMPHLEYVFISQERDMNPSTDLFRYNPQIRAIELLGIKPEFISAVSHILPHLETLRLGEIPQTNESIHFANVTTFSIDSFGLGSSLHFPRLQTLHMNHYSIFFENSLNFFNEHKHLIHLSIIHFDFKDSDFNGLTANLRDLVELTVQHSKYKPAMLPLNSQVILEFLRSHPNVKQLNVIDYPENWNVELQKQLNDEWNMQVNDAGTSFKRN